MYASKYVLQRSDLVYCIKDPLALFGKDQCLFYSLLVWGKREALGEASPLSLSLTPLPDLFTYQDEEQRWFSFPITGRC